MGRRRCSPNLLAPCTDAQAASPAANSPGTIALGFSAVGLSTSPGFKNMVAINFINSFKIISYEVVSSISGLLPR